MSKFEVGDYVRVIRSEEDDLGFENYISEIDEDGLICVGDEGLTYPLGCWHTADELAPATAPTAAAQGEGESWGVNPTERELVAYGDGYASGLMDGPEYAPLKNEIIALQAALQQAQRERDATDAAIAPFIAIAKSVIDNRHKLPWYNGDNPVAFSMGGVGVTFEDCSRLLSTMAKEYGRRAASAQQAANAEGGA